MEETGVSLGIFFVLARNAGGPRTGRFARTTGGVHHVARNPCVPGGDFGQGAFRNIDGVYGAYTIGSNVAARGADAGQPAVLSELTGEALYLARLVVALDSSGAEALGLLALMLYCEARREAQFDELGCIRGSGHGLARPLPLRKLAIWMGGSTLSKEFREKTWRAISPIGWP